LISFSPKQVGWGSAATLYVALAGWLISFPPSISGDDALFFVRGVERFSILEFRPHFPGYPGFILLGKAVHALGFSALTSLSIVNLLAALSIPPLAALCARHNRIGIFLFALSLPLLAYLGLSLMSDGAGIAFFLAALWQYRANRMATSGLLLAFTLACRPSFVVFVAAFLLFALITRKGPGIRLTAVCAIVCLSFLAGLFLLERTPLIWEGWRFIEGHFLIWGNTQVSTSTTTWLGSFASLKGGYVYASLLILSFVRAAPYTCKNILLYICIAGWGWTLLFQNPENLRHLALPVLLSGLLLADIRKKRINITLMTLLILCHLITLADYLVRPPALSPLAQSRHYLEKIQPEELLTNHGVHYLRDNLPHTRVFDRFYPYTTNDKRTILTSTKNSKHLYKKNFSARFPGEKTFWLTIPIK